MCLRLPSNYMGKPGSTRGFERSAAICLVLSRSAVSDFLQTHMYHSFLIHLSADSSRLLPCPGYYKRCCDEHWGTRVSFSSGFLGVYAQQWSPRDEA